MIQGKWKCECFRKDKYAKYNSSTLTNTSKNTLTNTPKYKRIVISYRGSGYPGTWTACYAVESGRGSRWKIWKDKKGQFNQSETREYYIQTCFLGMPSFQKSAVFLNIVQKAFDPPPFYLNICPILQGVFFERVFEHLI